MALITEEDVKRGLSQGEIKEKGSFFLGDRDLLTPSARSLLTEKGVSILQHKEQKTANSTASMKEYPEGYVTLFGAKLYEKPEFMTHLRGNILVMKDHPKIKLRGALDSLEAEIILVELQAKAEGKDKLLFDLEEIISHLRLLMRSEVGNTPLPEEKLLGLTEAEIRAQSHHPSQYFGIKHFPPTYEKGEMVARLNLLRTKARETELLAFSAFQREAGDMERVDIIRALNRLSSLFWIMMFRCLSGYYGG